MTLPIQRIQEIQQKKIQAEARLRAAITARHNREVQAFVQSPVYKLLTALKHVSLDLKLRRTIGPLLAHAIRSSNKDDVLNGRTSCVSMIRPHANSSAMWRCESADEGRVRYVINGLYGEENWAYGNDGVKLFEDSFVEYVAELLDPAAVSELTGTYIPPFDGSPQTDTTKRVIQAIT